jgi:hypothetical protein
MSNEPRELPETIENLIAGRDPYFGLEKPKDDGPWIEIDQGCMGLHPYKLYI